MCTFLSPSLILTVQYLCTALLIFFLLISLLLLYNHLLCIMLTLPLPLAHCHQGNFLMLSSKILKTSNAEIKIPLVPTMLKLSDFRPDLWLERLPIRRDIPFKCRSTGLEVCVGQLDPAESEHSLNSILQYIYPKKTDTKKPRQPPFLLNRIHSDWEWQSRSW
jgi:hypothetical protein